MLDSKNTDMSYTVPLMSVCLGERDKIISFLTRKDLTREAQAFFVSDHLGPIPLITFCRCHCDAEKKHRKMNPLTHNLFFSRLVA